MSRVFGLILALASFCVACEERVLEGRPALTREQLLNPETCKDCHPKHYEEWSASMHAYATRDPVFLAMNKRGQEESALGPFCVKCHAPMAVHENAIADYTQLESLPPQLQGVTCYFCHNAVGIGPEHNNANVELADDNTMRANLPRALIPSVHNVKRSALHDRARMESSQLCGTCHDIALPNGVHLERTLEEYEQSVFAETRIAGTFQSCQGCHMKSQSGGLAAVQSGIPGVSTQRREVHEHLFAAVDLPLTAAWPHADALRSAVEGCELPNSFASYYDIYLGERANFSVTLETTAGHNQPSGASQDRRMWLEVDGFDDAGKLIYSEGKIEDGASEPTPGDGSQHPCMLGDKISDDNGQPAHMFWQAAKYEQHTIPPSALGGVMHTYACDFHPKLVQPIPHLELRIRMRAMATDVLSDLVKSGHLAQDIVGRMPTLTVDVRRVDYDAQANRYIRSDNQIKPECNDYPCAIYPQGPGCDMTQGATAGRGP